MTFPDRVFGRRFTIWEGRGTALESGVAPKLQKPLTALRQEGRCSGDSGALGLWFHPPTIWT